MRSLLGLAIGIGCGRDAPPREPPPTATAAPDTRADAAACLAAAGPLAAPDAAVVRAACAEQQARRIPGVVVAVAEHGRVALRFAHGVRCSDRPGDVTGATAFRIGSLTKAITAATAFALAEGPSPVVDLDAPLGAAALGALGLDASLADATLRALLDHRAGLAERPAHAGLRGRDAPEVLAALVGPAIEPPGAGFRYANGGYVLAGAWLERRGGAPWSTLVRREVLAPLRMNGTRTDPDPTGDVACGHLTIDDAQAAFDVRADFERFAFGLEATAPAGGLVATADDLIAFALALSETSIDAPPWASRMRDAVLADARPTGRRADERYAAGLDVTTSGNELVLRHAGNTGDFFAELVWVPSRGAVAVVLGNAGVPMAATMAAALTRIGVDPRREPSTSP